MKRKRNLYTALIIIGLSIIAAIYLLLDRGLSSRRIGALMGIASGVIALSVSRLLALRMEQTDPALQKRNKIEQQDERNIAIRNRAKAMSGDILQWAVIGASWLSFALGAPSWILLLAAAALVAKCLIELYLTARYQGEM